MAIEVIHIRGRWACRMFSGSGVPGAVDALGAWCREDEEKARPAIEDLEAEATERPVLNRIKERAEAMVAGGQWQVRSQLEGKGHEL